MKHRNVLTLFLFLIFSALVLAGCTSRPAETEPESEEETETVTERETEAEPAMRMYINGTEVDVEWEDNESVAALKVLAAEGLEIQMSMYGGFEQVGPIGQDLPRNDEHTTTAAGDIVLYSGDQIVVFYGSNSWDYTRLGRIVGLTDEQLEDLLGREDTVLKIEMK